MSEESNVNIVQNIYADFAQGNVAGILDVLADDHVFIRRSRYALRVTDSSG